MDYFSIAIVDYFSIGIYIHIEYGMCKIIGAICFDKFWTLRGRIGIAGAKVVKICEMGK